MFNTQVLKKFEINDCYCSPLSETCKANSIHMCLKLLRVEHKISMQCKNKKKNALPALMIHLYQSLTSQRKHTCETKQQSETTNFATITTNRQEATPRPLNK